MCYAVLASHVCSLACATDNSTETFWESGDEDRNKTKSIVITCTNQQRPHIVAVHIDNSRDLGVSSDVAVTALKATSTLQQYAGNFMHGTCVYMPLPATSRCYETTLRKHALVASAAAVCACYRTK